MWIVTGVGVCRYSARRAAALAQDSTAFCAPRAVHPRKLLRRARARAPGAGRLACHSLLMASWSALPGSGATSSVGEVVGVPAGWPVSLDSMASSGARSPRKSPFRMRMMRKIRSGVPSWRSYARPHWWVGAGMDFRNPQPQDPHRIGPRWPRLGRGWAPVGPQLGPR